MIGQVDAFGRALVQVNVVLPTSNENQSLEVWIDTGFNGEIVLSQEQIDAFGLKATGTLKAVLADGSEIAMRRYSCTIEWFGQPRDLEVVANEGEYPLLGVGLLLGHDLHISYQTGEVRIE